MILQLAIAIALAATAIILHELAHGYAALALGDDTALRAHRLSFNPIRHIDRTGTLLIPGLLLFSQLVTLGHVGFMFGYAKPVPVDTTKFRYPRQMMALVALAGPAMNFTLAFLAAHLLRISTLPQPVVQAVVEFVLLNLVLGLFNLLPFPPLDGGRIAVGILPLPMARIWARAEKFGLVFVLALIAVPSLLRQQGIQIDPLGHLLNPAVEWAFAHILSFAGVADDNG